MQAETLLGGGYHVYTAFDPEQQDIIVPAGSAFIAIFVMLGYNLTESKMAEIKAELKKRRQE